MTALYTLLQTDDEPMAPGDEWYLPGDDTWVPVPEFLWGKFWGIATDAPVRRRNPAADYGPFTSSNEALTFWWLMRLSNAWHVHATHPLTGPYWLTTKEG